MSTRRSSGRGCADLVRRQVERLVREDGIAAEGRGQRRPLAHRQHEHALGQGSLELLGEHEVDQRAGAVLVPRAGEDAGELDLPEAGRRDRSGRRRLRGRLREHHLGRRARRVGDDDRPLALAAARARELRRVRLLPAVDHEHPVPAQLPPVIEPATLAEAGDRGQHECQPRGRRRGVLHDEQLPVGRLDEVVEARRRVEASGREPQLVDVEADVAVVDGRQLARRVEPVAPVDGNEALRLVRLEQACSHCAGEEVVVDAEDRVALRVPLRQQRAVQHLARIPALQDPELQAALPFERGLHLLRDREGVVRDEHDLLAAAVASRRTPPRGAPRRR